MTIPHSRRTAFVAILLPALLAAVAPAETQNAGAWLVSIKIDPIDDSKSAFAGLSGTADYSDGSDLVVSCDDTERLDVTISWHDSNRRNVLWSDDTMRTPVTYRFPPAKARTEMSLNMAHITFFEEPISFLRKLVDNDRLVARAPTSILDGQLLKITVEFDLTGAKAAIGKLAEVCGWSLSSEEEQSEGA